MIRVIIRTFLLTALLSSTMTLYAQTAAKTEILTNKNVIEISKAGLGNSVILSKINSSICKFDLSTSALIDLKKQGVAEDVINAMLNKSGNKATAQSEALPAAQPKKPASVPISLLNVVHYYDKGVPLSLEKSLGNSRSKKLALGYGGSNLILEIGGASSPVRLDTEKANSFIINTGGSNQPDLVLYKLKVEKGKRLAIVGKLTPSGPRSGEDMLPIEFSKAGDGMFTIKPGISLAKGEYFFTSKPNLNQSTSSNDVYAFTVL